MKRVVSVLLALLCAGSIAFAQGPVTPAAAVTGTIYNGGTPTVVRYQSVSIAANGLNIGIEAVSGFRIRVLAGFLTMTGTAVTIQFQDTGSGTALTGAFTPAAGQTVVLPFNPIGWFQTTASNRLAIALGGAQQVSGSLTYVLVP